MNINELTKTNTGEGGFDSLKATQYKLKADSSIVMKVHPDAFYPSWEFWVKPSDNLPADKDPDKSNYAFRVKNAEEHNLLAELLGGPDKWKVNTKRNVSFGGFEGGIYEFEYTDQKDKDGFAIKRWKYVHDPAHKEFFKAFSFHGNDYGMTEDPKVMPGLKYHTSVFIANDPICQESKTWRHIPLGHKLTKQLADFHNENFPLEHTWFKLKREGEGMHTRYTLLPLDGATNSELNETYDVTNLTEPDLMLGTQVSSNSYCWKYLQTYIRQMDKILGTNHSEVMEKDYNERQEAEAAATTEAPIPAAVASEASAPVQATASSPMNDDDIPF